MTVHSNGGINDGWNSSQQSSVTTFATPQNVAIGRLGALKDECDDDNIAAIEQALDRMQALMTTCRCWPGPATATELETVALRADVEHAGRSRTVDCAFDVTASTGRHDSASTGCWRTWSESRRAQRCGQSEAVQRDRQARESGRDGDD